MDLLRPPPHRLVRSLWRAALASKRAVFVLSLAACANAPPSDDVGAEASGDAGPAPTGAGCTTHSACADGLLCIFNGVEGHCADPCTLTGACASAPDAPDPAGATPGAGSPDGAPCTTNADCAGATCLTEVLGYPSGQCTTRDCLTATDCHGVESRCLAAGAGPAFCVPACVGDENCRLGYACRAVAGGGFCAPQDSAPPPTPDPSEPAPPEPEPEPAPEPAPGGGAGATFTEFCDDVQVEDNFYGDGWDRYTMAFDVPPGTFSFQVLAGAAADFGGFESLSGGGLDIDFAQDFQRVNMLIPAGDTVNAVQLPHLPGIRAEQLAGHFTLRVASHEVPFCPVLVAKTSAGSRINLNVTLAPGNGVPDAASAARDPRLQDVLRRADDMYRQAGLTLNAVNYRNLSAADQARFAIVRTEADLPDLFRTTEALGDSVDQALTINLVIVQQILIEDGTVLGVSGGIPGPAGAHGFPTSGVVMTAAVLSDPEVGSQTMAHELGHFLGLYHTTEVDSVMADVLGDTPECPADAWQQPDLPCPDLENLMFPYAHPGAQITPQQVLMLHTSPLVK